MLRCILNQQISTYWVNLNHLIWTLKFWGPENLWVFLFHPLTLTSTHQIILLPSRETLAQRNVWITDPPGALVWTEQVLTAHQDNGTQSVQTGRYCPGTGEAVVNNRWIDKLINKPSSDKLIPPRSTGGHWLDNQLKESLVPPSCLVGKN